MAEVTCHQCGEKNSPDSQFCYSCEAFLAWEGTAEIAARAALARGEQVAAAPISPAPSTDAPASPPAAQRPAHIARAPESARPVGPPPGQRPSGQQVPGRQPAAPPAASPPSAGPRDPGATFVLPPAALKVVVEPGKVTLAPGGETASVAVQIFNLSRVVDAYSVTIDRGPRWLQVGPAEVRLLPGTDENVSLTLSIPRGPLVFAQTVRLPVWVRSQANAAIGYQSWLEVTVPVVEAPVGLRLEPSLLRVRSGTEGTLIALVDNRAGNAPLKVKFSGQDPERAISFTFVPPVLVVPPGKEASCRLAVRAPAPEPGQSINRPFTITGTDGDRTFPAAGTLVQSTPALVVDAPVSLRIEPSVVRVLDSESGNFAAVIDNRGGTRWVRVGLTGSDPEQSLRFTFSPSVLDVPPGRQISTQVQIRGRTPEPGKELSRQFTLHGVDGKAEFSTTATFIQVSSPPAISQVTLKLDPAVVRLRDQGAGQFLLLADNRDGSRAVRLRLQGRDPERIIAFRFYPEFLEVPAGGVATAQVQVSAPLPEPSQEVNLSLTVSGTDGAKTVEAAGTMIITTSAPAIEALSVRLDPAVARSQNGRVGFFQAIVDNRAGQHPVRVYLGGDDPENVIGFTITPAVLDIGPGQVAAAQVRVEAPRPPAGQEITRPLTILASDGRKEVSASGSLVQNAAASTPIAWILFTLLGGLAMIAGVFLPWLSGQRTLDGLDWNLPQLERTFNFELNVMEQIAPVISVGAVLAILGLLVILGLTGKGRLTRAAALLGAVAMVGLLVAVSISGESAMPLSGAITILIGCVFGFVGGLLRRR